MNLDGDAFKLKRMMRQDAHEKAFEIQVLGQRDGEKESERIYTEEMNKLEKRHEDEMQNQQIEHRKMVARENNKMRVQKMVKRNACLDALKVLAMNRLQSQFDKDTPQYQATLKNLIIQGMIKLLEDNLELRVREDEVDLVKGILSECEEEYTDIMKRETTRDYSCTLTVREDSFLTIENGGRCGGVVLYAHNRRIVCSNTLEDRLNQIFECELPLIRKGLFPRAK